MLKHLKLSVLFIISLVKLSFGQVDDGLKLYNGPLRIVITSSADTIKGRALLIDPEEVHALKILKRPDAIAKYGNEGDSGVVEFYLNPNVKVFDFSSFKKDNKIEQYRQINVSIDGRSIVPTSLIFTRKGIRDIKKQVIKQGKEINIEITSRHPVPKHVAGQPPVIRQ